VLENKYIILNQEKQIFQLFFLIKNKNQDIEVIEVEKIDFAEVKKRLEKGESVYITRKRKKKLESISVASEEMVEPWYFTHS